MAWEMGRKEGRKEQGPVGKGLWWGPSGWADSFLVLSGDPVSRSRMGELLVLFGARGARLGEDVSAQEGQWEMVVNVEG